MEEVKWCGEGVRGEGEKGRKEEQVGEEVE